jgi:hypothetical protein
MEVERRRGSDNKSNRSQPSLKQQRKQRHQQHDQRKFARTKRSNTDMSVQPRDAPTLPKMEEYAINTEQRNYVKNAVMSQSIHKLGKMPRSFVVPTSPNVVGSVNGMVQ